MFKEPFKPTDPLNMHDECEVCGQSFNPEPGFYYGAMFLSYILSGWFLIVPALILVFVLKWTVNGAMIFVIALAALTYFKFMRFSRSLWIHINVKYDKHFDKKLKEVES